MYIVQYINFYIHTLNSLFENMERICDEKYVPTPTDVLRARVRTNGIIETHFRMNDVIIRYYYILVYLFFNNTDCGECTLLKHCLLMIIMSLHLLKLI